MPTECTPRLFGFGAIERKAVTACFDGGAITSNAGALLLGQVDRGLGLVRRFAACFTDRRDARYVEHRVETLVGQRIFALALPLRPSTCVLILARRLDGGFHGLSAGIAEENKVGEVCLAQPLGETFGFGNAIEIRDMPHLANLLTKRRQQVRMSVAKSVDRHARGEVQIALAIGPIKPNAFPPLKSYVSTRIDGQKVRCHERFVRQ
jgi:hypothetical protein